MSLDKQDPGRSIFHRFLEVFRKDQPGFRQIPKMCIRDSSAAVIAVPRMILRILRFMIFPPRIYIFVYTTCTTVQFCTNVNARNYLCIFCHILRTIPINTNFHSAVLLLLLISVLFLIIQLYIFLYHLSILFCTFY